MERFADIKLKSYNIKKEYYPEKDYVKCPECPRLLHCSYCVQHLRDQNPHHWVGITMDEVPGCRGCRERYLRGIAEARNEAISLRTKLNILETGLMSPSQDLMDAQEIADEQLPPQQLAYEAVEMDLSAEIEDLSKSNENTESIVGMKLRLELEKMKEAYERTESRVTFLKRRPPDSAAAGTPRGSGGSTLPVLGDVTIVVQGQKIYAHQLILGSKSNVFKMIFEHLHLDLRQNISPTSEQVVTGLDVPVLPPPCPTTLKQVETTLVPPVLPPPPSFNLTQVETDSIPPIPPPPPPPPPPPLPPPREDPSPKICEEKSRKKRDRVHPVVKVRLVSSSMLAQMGRRGVRCHLTVAETVATDRPEMNCNEDGGRTEVRGIDNGQGLQSGVAVLEASMMSAPLAVPIVTRVQAQTITPEATLQLASNLTPTAILETVKCQAPVNTVQLQILAPEATHQLASTMIPVPNLEITECQAPANSPANSVHPQRFALEAMHQRPSNPGPTVIPPQVLPILECQALGKEENQREISEKNCLMIAPPDDAKAIIEVHDSSYGVMQAVINCCYTGDIEFTKEVSPGEVLKAAHKYEINYLKDLCERELCQRLNSGNVSEMLKLGCKFGAKRLHSQATQFFKDNFDDVQEMVLKNWCELVDNA